MKKYLLIFFLLQSGVAFSNSGKAEVTWDRFLSKPHYLTTQLDDYHYLSLDYNFKYDFKSFQWNSYIVGQYFFDSSGIYYLSAPNMYLSYLYKFNNPSLFIRSINLSFGRKVQTWSLADEHWDFGLWQPLNRWNPLHPMDKGLIGTFVNVELKNWSIDMLVGGLYIPSTYTKAEIKNNKVTSSSRWFLGAPQKVDILGRDILDIEYLIKTPFILDIFFQQSYILSFKTWLDKKNKTWSKWVFGYKPINDLFIVTNTKDVLDLNDMKVQAKVSVLPVRHKVISSELGFDYNDFSTVFSVGYTSVQEDRAAPEGWEFLHDRGKFTYFSALLKYHFLKNNYLQVSFLDSWFDRNLSEEDYKGEQVAPFVFNHYKILNGFGLDLHFKYFSKKNFKRQLDIKYKYSIPNKGGLLSAEATYYVRSNLYTSLTLDVLGSDNKSDKYFLDKFRANDYVGWRVSYVF
ncbi:MAG: hypothetical protein ACR2M7_05680 [Bdellovibrionales bacterium]